MDFDLIQHGWGVRLPQYAAKTKCRYCGNLTSNTVTRVCSRCAPNIGFMTKDQTRIPPNAITFDKRFGQIRW